MLQRTDYGGGGGGGRPPVNIEVNFVTGKGGSAFSQARDDLAAIKRDIAEINAKGLAGGGLGGIGGGGGGGGGIRFNGYGGGGGVYSGGASPVVSTSATMANIAAGGYRATGISSITGQPMPTMPVGATAPIAGGAISAGGAIGLPLAALAALGVGIGANTPQGIEAIGGLGSWLESRTNKSSFASQFFATAGLPAFANPAAAFNATLGPFSESRRLQERTNRMLRGQIGPNMSAELAGVSSVGDAGMFTGLETSLQLREAQNNARSGFARDMLDRGGLSPESRMSYLEMEKEAKRTTLEIEQAKLRIAEDELQIRIREKEAVQQMVDSRFNALAGMNRGELRKAERYLEQLNAGKLDIKGANFLDRFIDDGRIDRIQETFVKGESPKLAALLEKLRADRQKSEDDQTEAVAEMRTTLNALSESIIKTLQELNTELEGVRADVVSARTSKQMGDRQLQNVPSGPD